MTNTEKTVVILQSNYVPWKGYFDLIRHADVFVIFDDAQYTDNDWRNRNKIKTPQGLQWITIPVLLKGRFGQKIRETKISRQGWSIKHWKSIVANYAKAPFFKNYKDEVEDLYRTATSEYLSEINYHFLTGISAMLEIEPNFKWSSEFTLAAEKTERLLGICVELGATKYLSGPAAKDYINESLFKEAGISVEYFDYSRYPQYQQLHGEFSHGVSIIDLLFNTGSDAVKYLRSFS